MKDVSRLYTSGDIESLKPPPLPADHIYTSCYCEENIYLLAKHFLDEADKRPSHDWASLWDVFVVFISNDEKTVALWKQKARDDVVVWDYHVILVLRPRPHCAELSGDGEMPEIPLATHAWIYDYDSRLPMPCSSKEYVAGTFPYVCVSRPPYDIPENLVSLFRVVLARDYLDYFASDRSHMLKQGREGVYLSAPPLYPPLCGMKAREMQIFNNLMCSFVTMRRSPAGHAQQRMETEGLITEARKEHVHGAPAPRVYGEVLDMPAFLSWLGASSARDDGDRQ